MCSTRVYLCFRAGKWGLDQRTTRAERNCGSHRPERQRNTRAELTAEPDHASCPSLAGLNRRGRTGSRYSTSWPPHRVGLVTDTSAHGSSRSCIAMCTRGSARPCRRRTTCRVVATPRVPHRREEPDSRANTHADIIRRGGGNRPVRPRTVVTRWQLRHIPLAYSFSSA